MKMKPKDILAIAIIAILVIGNLITKFQLNKARQNPEIIRDTTIVTKIDTFVQTVKDREYVHIYHTKIDTLFLKDTAGNDVPVQVPIEYKHEHYSDADVYYHGFEAGVDSVKTYPKTVYETIHEIEWLPAKATPKPWGIGVQAGYGISTSGQLAPYIGIGISYNILRW